MSSFRNRLYQLLIEPSPKIQDVSLRIKSQLLSSFLLILIFVFAGVDTTYLLTVKNYQPPWYGYIFLIVSYLLNRSGRYSVSAFLVSAMFPIVIVLNIASGESTSPVVTLYYLVSGLILAAILLTHWGVLVLAVAGVAIALFAPTLVPNQLNGFQSVIGPFSTILISMALLLVYMRSRDQIEKERSAALQAAEKKYRDIFEQSVDGIFQSTPQGRYLSVNPSMARIYGFSSPKEMLTHVTDIQTQIYLNPIDRERFTQLLELNSEISGFEAQHRKKDDSLIWVSTTARTVSDAQGIILYYEGSVEDITRRKEVESERENLLKTLEIKNAELEQYTYTVSHDLKAPIITIKGFLGFLIEDAKTGNIKRLEADIIRISQAAEKMQRLLNDLLELSRIGRLVNPPTEIDFHELLNTAKETVFGSLQKNNITVISKGVFPKVYGDRERLLEVLQNLLDNAAKFTGEQPHPTIEVGCDEVLNNGFITFFVRDNGIGIDSQFHERIFGLFNRLNPEVEGTGVGLSLVKRIVEFHGGKVWVKSEAGQGATFYFTLPQPSPSQSSST
jgi:PAS domain S-box-containing protein